MYNQGYLADLRESKHKPIKIMKIWPCDHYYYRSGSGTKCTKV